MILFDIFDLRDCSARRMWLIIYGYMLYECGKYILQNYIIFNRMSGDTCVTRTYALVLALYVNRVR